MSILEESLDEVDADPGHESNAEESPALPTDSTIRQCRKQFDSAMQEAAKRSEKSRWCDKSLPNVMFPGLLRRMYPEAQFICIYRHCMDVIASGVEACKWGFNGYGFERFVASSPDNLVRALGQYWLSHTKTEMEFERENPNTTYRIYYEALATSPADTLKKLAEYLGLPDSDCWEQAMESGSSKRGPGDYKIAFQTGIDVQSIGRGSGVPVRLLPDPLLAQINESLDGLGYPTIGPDWNEVPSPLAIRQVKNFETNGNLDELLTNLQKVQGEALISLGKEHQVSYTVSVLFDDLEDAAWTIDFSSGYVNTAGGPEDVCIITSSKTLFGLARGVLHPAVAMRGGDCRVVAKNTDDPFVHQQILVAVLDAVRSEGHVGA